MKYMIFGKNGKITSKSIIPIVSKSDPEDPMPIAIVVDLFATIEEELELPAGIYHEELLERIMKFVDKVYQSRKKFGANGEVIVISEYMGDCAMMYKVDFIGSIIGSVTGG